MSYLLSKTPAHSRPLKPRRKAEPLTRVVNQNFKLTTADLKDVAKYHAKALVTEQKGSLISRFAKASTQFAMGAGNVLSKAVGSVVKYAGGATLAFGLVTGMVDHLSKPNSDDEATGPRIVKFGAENVLETARLVAPEIVEAVGRSVAGGLRPGGLD